MSRYKRQTDLYFTDDGDFYLDENTSDLEDTRLLGYRGFIQRVLTQMQSQKREWAQQRDVGAGVADFLGKPNTAEVGERIRNRVFSELTRNSLILPSDLNVRVFPIGTNQVAIIVEITPPDVLKKLVLTFSYDLRDNRVVPRNV